MVIRFKPKTKPTRDHVKRWISRNFDKFPSFIPGDIGPDMFHGWRFVRGDDGVIYFANCIDRGITEGEVFPAILVA